MTARSFIRLSVLVGVFAATALARGVGVGAGAASAGESGAGLRPAAARPPSIQDVRAWDWAEEQHWANAAVRPLADAQKQVSLAYELEKQRDWDQAAAHYFLAVKAWPASKEAPLALQRLARVLYAMSDHYRAFRVIDQIFDSYPESAHAPAQAEVLLAVDLRIANRLLDLAAEPARRVEYTARGIYIPRPEEYVEQAENIFSTMLIRLDEMFLRAGAGGQVDDAATEKRRGLARAIARGQARAAERK